VGGVPQAFRGENPDHHMGRPTTVVVMLQAWNNVTSEESAVGRLSINIIGFYLSILFLSRQQKYFYIYSRLEKFLSGDMESTLCLWAQLLAGRSYHTHG
jgi:hypothetical protein